MNVTRVTDGTRATRRQDDRCLRHLDARNGKRNKSQEAPGAFSFKYWSLAKTSSSSLAGLHGFGRVELFCFQCFKSLAAGSSRFPSSPIRSPIFLVTLYPHLSWPFCLFLSSSLPMFCLSRFRLVLSPVCYRFCSLRFGWSWWWVVESSFVIVNAFLSVGFKVHFFLSVFLRSFWICVVKVLLVTDLLIVVMKRWMCYGKST